VAAALIGTAYVTRYAGQQDILGVSTIGGPVVEQATQWPSQDSRKTDSLALQQRTEADQASAQAVAQEAAQVEQAVEPAAPEARQSLEKEQRPEVLANELAEARRAIDGLNLQLQAGATKTAQLLGQEREKTAGLVQEATAARQELTASTVQHRHALEEESARSAALASELAMARREIETQVALLRKAGDEAVQLKRAAERSMAELRQSLQQERDRAEARARDLETVRRTIDGRVTPEHAAKTEQPAAAEAQGSPEATRLIARARALLGQGNIGAARIVLERAAETGSAQASFMLAETYDPVILSAWGTYGTRGEATKARELYAKAHAGGIQEAKDRVNALR
jgi:chromosome segregation ATPase